MTTINHQISAGLSAWFLDSTKASDSVSRVTAVGTDVANMADPIILELERRLAKVELERDQEREMREEAERLLRNTNLLEFLDICHTKLHMAMTVQSNLGLATKGCADNAKFKLRPDHIRHWTSYEADHKPIWQTLVTSIMASERRFPSRENLAGVRKNIRSDNASELDLHFFQRLAIENNASLIIQEIFKDNELRNDLGLRGFARFENHSNTISIESKSQGGGSAEPPQTPAPSENVQANKSLADQFCVYHTMNRERKEHRAACFMMEYKAPHKLPIEVIKKGLCEMDVKNVIESRENTLESSARMLVAAVITQAFSYMIHRNTAYGCICTGEACIFLHIQIEPQTVYYHLSIPKEDLGDFKTEEPISYGQELLRFTAVGQLLSFTLRALNSPGDPKLREKKSLLHVWEVDYDEVCLRGLLDSACSKTSAGSEYLPTPDSGAPNRRNRVLTRQYCKENQETLREDSAEELDTDTPSRPPLQSRTRVMTRNQNRTQETAGRTRSGKSVQFSQNDEYCTQDCLRGMLEGGPLDLSCPNAKRHGEEYHSISQDTFLALIREQLSKDTDKDWDAVSMPYAVGVLFRVQLEPYGYTVAAKGTTSRYVSRLDWEAKVYEKLRAIQGIYIPVCLGTIPLKQQYDYEGMDLVHMLFMSHGGSQVSNFFTDECSKHFTKHLDQAAQAIHHFGVLHKDLEPRNMLWNQKLKRIMVIDFERSEIRTPEPAPTVDPPGMTLLERLDSMSGFEKERKAAVCNMLIRCKGRT